GGPAQVFDVSSGKGVSPEWPSLSLGPGTHPATLSPDGTLVAIGTNDHSVRIVRKADGSEIARLALPSPPLSVRFSDDGKRLVTTCGDPDATGTRDLIARGWSVPSGRRELKLTGHVDVILCAAFSHDGRRIVTAGRDRTARVWDAATGAPVGVPLPHQSWVYCASFAPDNRLLVTGSFDRNAHVWDLGSGKEIPPALPHDDGVSCAQFSPDGRLIVTGGFDRTIRLWWAKDHQPFSPHSILRHSAHVLSCAFAPDGRQLLSTCYDGTVRIWDLAGSIVPGNPRAGPFSDDGRRCVDVGECRLQINDTATGRP